MLTQEAKVKALVIPVEGPLEEIDLPKATGESLKKLQEIVGGYIETVPIPSFIKDGNRATAIINEEGKYLPDCAPNMRATDFMVPGRGIGWGDYIAGNMVLIGYEGYGDHCDVPEGVVARARLIEEEAA